MNEESQNTITPTKSLLYWRKSKLNGMDCVPVIIALDESRTFSLKTADNNVEFSVPASETTVKFSSWGTMAITVNGKTYDIVGVGAGTSPDPTTEQLQEIQDAGGTSGDVDTNLSTVGAAGTALSGASAGAGVVGSAAMQYAYYKGLEAIKAWQRELPKAGATIQASKMNAMKYFSIGIAVLVVIFLAIALLTK
jgi:hypothetical protein